LVKGTSALTDYINKTRNLVTLETASPAVPQRKKSESKATDLLNGLFKEKESCRYD
jgi:hypothetical protein